MSLDKQSQAVVDGLNASGVLPFRQHDAAAIRAKVLSLRVAKPANSLIVMASIHEETVETPGGGLKVRVLRPVATVSVLPVVIYFHGGGFFAGGLDETDELTRKIADRCGVTVVNVDYRLSPEAKFPDAVDDAYAALCWVAAEASRLGIDPARIVVAGDSAGGNLTIVTCLMARERGGPSILFQVPIYPSLDMRSRPEYASRKRWGGGEYILDNDDIEWMRSQYLKSDTDAQDWRASPILASSYAGLPPALVITADHDPLVDEGRIYTERLSNDGVAAEYACFKDTFHGFIGYASVLDVGARAIDLICDRVRHVVGPLPA